MMVSRYALLVVGLVCLGAEAFAPRPVVLTRTTTTTTTVSLAAVTTNGDTATAAVEYPKKVAVAGATGRTGYLIVQELLKSTEHKNVQVVGLVRNITKAEEMLPSKFNSIRYEPNLEVKQVDFSNPTKLQQAVDGCDAVIWAATGFTNNYDPSAAAAAAASQGGSKKKEESILDKVLGVLGLNNEKGTCCVFFLS